MKVATLTCALILFGCVNPGNGESYQLTVESCYEMFKDETHPYWRHPVTVQGCDLLITEFEETNLRN